jgi:pilus assembly protein CpaE
MRPLTQIVVATKQADFAKKIEQALNSNRHVSLSSTCDSLPELRACLESSKIPIAVVDIDPGPQKILCELDQLVQLFPETKFTVASSTSNKKLIIEAMQAGARHFMHKKFLEAELDRVLERLLVNAARNGLDIGTIMTVFSASGGCGATTVSLNLANELRLRYSKPVLAVDLDNHYGAVSHYLGITSKYGIADVLDQTDRIDSQLIASSSASYKNNFDVLISSSGISNGAGRIKYTNLSKVLEACKEAYKYTVVDAPRVSRNVMKQLANSSRIIVVVFQPNVKDIKSAKSMLSALKEFGVSSEKIFPLVNKFRRRAPMVPFEEIQRNFGSNRLYRMRSDFKRIVNCVNRGEPLSELAPRSAVRKDFCKIVKSICAYNENGNSKVLE